MPANKTKPKAAAKKAAPRSKAPTTIAACDREMKAHEADYRAYQAARRVKNAELARLEAAELRSRAGHEAGAAEAQATMEEHRAGYTAYWRAHEARRALVNALPLPERRKEFAKQDAKQKAKQKGAS